MLEWIISYLLLLNPFALFLYLEPVRKELAAKDFCRVLVEASVISGAIFYAFFLSNDLIFNHIFKINLESFRIFGGITLFSFAYLYVVKGQKALVSLRQDLDDVAAEIALPFMVGAGTISVSILMGQSLSSVQGALVLLIVFVITVGMILLLTNFRARFPLKKLRVVFDKNMEILLRLNGFFLGAIGVDMIQVGIKNLFF